MNTPDDLAAYLADLLAGTYDCTDRMALRGYYPLGQTSGGLLTWWSRLRPGVPLVYHYHFHIVDRQWGHLTIRMSGHPPFGVQVTLNGHEWVQRQAEQQAIAWVKEGNCFVSGSDLTRLSAVAKRLDGAAGLAQLAQVCDRWVYSAGLCFALTREQQERSDFRYAYSCFQLEYSRNLLFKSGRQLDEIYQGRIDRTRRLLDVAQLKTIFGRKHRPHQDRRGSGRLEKIVQRPNYDLTVFKLHFGKLTLKRYDKGDRVLRVEVIVQNIDELRCGRRVEKLPGMLARLERMVVEFLAVVQAAHCSFLDDRQLDALATPTARGVHRVAGVDLQKPRMRAVSEAVLALGAAPEGFTSEQLSARVGQCEGRKLPDYHRRQAAYDLRKLRSKGLVERIARTRRYRPCRTGIRTLAGLLILREKVLKPVLAGVGRPKPGRPPKNVHPLDVHYQNLQREMLATLRTLHLAA